MFICTCRIVIGRMPSTESRLKRYLMETVEKTIEDDDKALGKRDGAITHLKINQESTGGGRGRYLRIKKHL